DGVERVVADLWQGHGMRGGAAATRCGVGQVAPMVGGVEVLAVPALREVQLQGHVVAGRTVGDRRPAGAARIPALPAAVVLRAGGWAGDAVMAGPSRSSGAVDGLTDVLAVPPGGTTGPWCGAGRKSWKAVVPTVRTATTAVAAAIAKRWRCRRTRPATRFHRS